MSKLFWQTPQELSIARNEFYWHKVSPFCVCVRHNTVHIYSFMTLPWPSKTPQLGQKEQNKIKTEICVPHPSTAARALRPTVASISPLYTSERTLFFPTAAANFAAGGCGAWWTTLRFPLALEKFRFSLLRSWFCVCEGLRAIDVCVRRTRFSPRSFFPLYSQGVCSNL